MRFPRETVIQPKLTPSHIEGFCIAMVPRGAKKKPANSGGRACVSVKNEYWRAHRLSFHLNVHPIPRSPKSKKIGLVLHRCDNGWCINPKHLYIGTAQQNTKDIYERNKFIRHRKSEAHKGNQNAKGYSFTKEQREHQRLTSTGRTHSEETKKKMSISAKEIWRERHAVV